MAIPPTVEDVAAYLGLAAEPDGLADDLDSALERQASRCVVDPYTMPLRQAAIRRAARAWAARGHVLGTIDAGDFGMVGIARWDVEISDYEAAYRRPGFAGPGG